MERFLPRHVIVQGTSMLPALRPGQRCVVLPYLWMTPQIRDIVLAMDPRNGRMLLKRIIHMQKTNGELWLALAGDNAAHSTDSRDFGLIIKKHLFGKVVYPTGL